MVTISGKRRCVNYFRRQAQLLLGSRPCRSNRGWDVGVEVRWVGVRVRITVTEGEEALWLGLGEGGEGVFG